MAIVWILSSATAKFSCKIGMLRARRRFVSGLVLLLRNYLRAMSEEGVKKRQAETYQTE